MPKSLEQKQTEADERRVAHAKLTPEDQLARIEGRPGKAAKERAKLLKKIGRR